MFVLKVMLALLLVQHRLYINCFDIVYILQENSLPILNNCTKSWQLISKSNWNSFFWKVFICHLIEGKDDDSDKGSEASSGSKSHGKSKSKTKRTKLTKKKADKIKDDDEDAASDTSNQTNRSTKKREIKRIKTTPRRNEKSGDLPKKKRKKPGTTFVILWDSE